ncbi:Signal recognition particle receptor FtsY [Candidatus Hartigia pinicola]|nr:Signal recognition particle receptor FtsY [Candidatus Hartigia pinicola]
MAKNKKKNFFSWLGIGRKDKYQTQQKEMEQQKIDEKKKIDLKKTVDKTPVKISQKETSCQDHLKKIQNQPIMKGVKTKFNHLFNESQTTIHIPQVKTENPYQIKKSTIKSEVLETHFQKHQSTRSSILRFKNKIQREEEQSDECVKEKIASQQKKKLTAIKSVDKKKEQTQCQEKVICFSEQQQVEPKSILEYRYNIWNQKDEELKTIEEDKLKKRQFISRLKKGLIKTRQNIGSSFFSFLSGKKIDAYLFERLEEQLLVADVGVETTRKIINNLIAHTSCKDLKNAELLYSRLREEMTNILVCVDKPLIIKDDKTYVILIVGVNGVGKTTTVGKLARQYQLAGKSVMLAAGDTFRVAAIEQLQVWGERNKIPVISQHRGADPASVIFDALQLAQAKKISILIADTAGRLQNKTHLMEELKKIVRVMKKVDPHAPHEIMLTLDANTGLNAVSQAKVFHEAVGVTGIILTKLDGTAKGGVIFSISDQLSIPIRYIGIGEGIEDLRPFKSNDFIEALFAREE